MEIHLPICVTCGVQYDGAAEPAELSCKICQDERQYVGWGGQRWTSLAELAAAGHRTVVKTEIPDLGTPDLYGVGTEPSTAIGQRALLVPGPGGNVMWDCVTYLDEASVAEVERRGGIAAIAISHPHYYGSAVEWSRAFGDAPIYIHEADAEWICRDGNWRTWRGDVLAILDGRTLVNCGVHFAGGTVLHWSGGAAGRGALCSGDIFQVVMDRRWVSFMYSYPNLIPEPPETIRRALALVEPFPFEVIYGAWWGRVVASGAKDALARSAERYLRHAGH